MMWTQRASALTIGALGAAVLFVLTPAAHAAPISGRGATVVQHSLPDTEILEGPPKQTSSRKARFVFAATPTATFTCALDKKPATPCTSPYKAKDLKLGKHKVTITATDYTGTESSPAKYKWKVIKKADVPGCTGECRGTAASAGVTTYVACSLKPSAEPARKCNLSGPKAAFLRSTTRDVVYKVCVKLVEKGEKPLCASGIEAPKGKTTLISLALSTAGKYTATWSVAGKVVGSREFKIIDDLQ